MPILQRLIKPVHVSRETLPLEVPNELECITNGTLANIIRQLSSLSKHAEDIFSVLCQDSASIQARMNLMKGRIDRLTVKVTQLDSNVEEVSLQDIHMRKAFKSSFVYEQQVVSRDTIPVAMAEIYQQCDRPPPLEKLNPYREDGKNGLKFYTDPNCFFKLWRNNQLMETEKMLQGRGKKHGHLHGDCIEPHRPKQDGKRPKKVRAPQNSKEKYKQIAQTNDMIDHYGSGHQQFRQAQPVQVRQGYYQDTDPHSHQRPNSLEIQNSYVQGQDGSGKDIPNSANEPYPPPPYTEHYQPQDPPPYYQQDGFSNSPQKTGTPTNIARNRTVTAMRPSQPPPAPPPNMSNNGSAHSTPSQTPSVGSPSNGGRMRASSHSRDNLPPPPPPPPDAMVNGNMTVHQQYQMMKGQTPVGSPAHNYLNSSHNSQQSTPSHISNNVPGSREHTPAPHLDNSNATPDGLDLPPPPPTPDLKSLNHYEDSVLPPPSPPPPVSTSDMQATNVPAPPPPPPPNMIPNGGMNVNRLPVSEIGSISSESSTITSSSASRTSDNANSERKIKIVGANSNASAPNDAVGESRSDLLAAIREGIKLKKVEDSKKKEVEKSSTPHDVASILARRVAMEFSDSDSASESEYDSEAWDDETEC